MTGSFMPYGFTCNHLELNVNDRVTLLKAGQDVFMHQNNGELS